MVYRASLSATACASTNIFSVTDRIVAKRRLWYFDRSGLRHVRYDIQALVYPKL